MRLKIIYLLICIGFVSSCEEPEKYNPLLKISSTDLVFEANEIQKTIKIENDGTGSFTFNISVLEEWISVSPQTKEVNSDPVTVTITVDRTGLAYVTQTAEINVNSDKTQDQTITITLKNPEPNNPPEAAFNISNAFGDYTHTVWSFDASASSDKEDDNSTLQVQWQWEEGGTFTSWANTKTTTHIYENTGEKKVTVQVKDADDGISSLTKTLFVKAPEKGKVESKSCEAVDYNSAILVGQLTDLGKGALLATNHGFYYGLSSSAIETDQKVSLGEISKIGAFNIRVENLQSSSTYRVRAYMVNVAGETVSTSLTFNTTMPTAPQSIVSGNISDITQSTAILNGKINVAGLNIEIASFGHCYGILQNPCYTDNKIELINLEGNGEFSSYIQGLTSNTLYYVRGFFKTTNGNVVYGEQIEFSTLK